MRPKKGNLRLMSTAAAGFQICNSKADYMALKIFLDIYTYKHKHFVMTIKSLTSYLQGDVLYVSSSFATIFSNKTGIEVFNHKVAGPLTECFIVA